MQPEILAAAELELRKREKERRSFYRDNPLQYFKDRLGINPQTIDWNLIPEYKTHIWDGTPNPFMSMINCIKNKKWVGVESATGTGKTFNAALLVLWFLECFENSLVITTAPKEAQLMLHVWKEIGKVYDKFNKGYLTKLRLRMKEDRDDWIAVGFVAGVGANEDSSTKAQGFHAENMLIILEETPGISKAIINAFQNTCTSPNNIILALGNPDHQLDELHQFCMQPNVEHIRISAYDHPNVVLDNPSFIPGACSKAGINRIINRFGIDHPLCKSRTKGMSPAEAEDSLIKLSWCSDAKQRQDVLKEAVGNLKLLKGTKAIGGDVANSEGGDKAAIAFGINENLLYVNDFACPDSNQFGKRDILSLMRDEGVDERFVGIDGVGVGAGTINALKEMNKKVQSLIGSESAITNEKEEQFKNLRSQMYWQMREDLRNNIITLPNDEQLFADLTTPKWFVKDGKIVIESKEDIKKRLGHSPNKGDAAVYWNWVRVQRKISNVVKTVIY